MKPSIQLGVDGNCGFALLGEDLQSGEAEFVEIEHPFRDPDGTYSPASRYEMIAAGKAKVKLCERLGLNPHRVRHYYGPSHPYGR